VNIWFLFGEKNERSFARESSFILGVILSVISLVGFCIAFSKNSRGWCALCFAIMLIVAVSALYGSFAVSPDVETYRVAYHAEDSLVLISDINGKTVRMDLSKVSHATASYEVGDTVQILVNAFGTPLYLNDGDTIVVRSLGEN
jgi:hypothetical protein